MAFWETLAAWGVISHHDNKIAKNAMSDLNRYTSSQGNASATQRIWFDLGFPEKRKALIIEAYGYEPGSWDYRRVYNDHSEVNERAITRKVCEKRGIQYYNPAEDPGYQAMLTQTREKMNKRWFK